MSKLGSWEGWERGGGRKEEIVKKGEKRIGKKGRKKEGKKREKVKEINKRK